LHTLPQLPQLFGSDDVSTQPLHIDHESGHVHTPLPQYDPDGQTTPQLPQLLGSAIRSTQVQPQEVPEAHMGA
jgi:hypothetical protein